MVPDADIPAATAAAAVAFGVDLGRDMMFHKPEEGAPSDERPQTKPQEHLTRGQLEEGDLGLLPTLKPELEWSLGMPMTGEGIRVGRVTCQTH